MSKFQEFVKKNEVWFRGRFPETDASLDRVESELGLKIPSDIRWLLKEYGYWHGTGISNIEESIEETRLARAHVQLPDKYIVLYDHHDGGVILLDTETDEITGNNRVIDSAWESIPDNLEQETIYTDLIEYAKNVIAVQAEILDEEDVECRE